LVRKELHITCQYLNFARIEGMKRRYDFSGDDIRKDTSIVVEVCIISLNLHFAGISSGTRYMVLSMWSKKTPTDQSSFGQWGQSLRE
jgi:hypothetical protein